MCCALGGAEEGREGWRFVPGKEKHVCEPQKGRKEAGTVEG